MEKQSFEGPLFVVGMPRSGTKLLRDLLNRNPKISIPVCESHFIPFFLKKYGNEPDFKNEAEKANFICEIKNTNFVWDLEKLGYNFDESDYLLSVDFNSWQSIFSELFKSLGPKKRKENIIWGDKTPGYVRHISLLKKLFPRSKFAHIIRDPRDYCNSVKKTWGKSAYRAAFRWADTLEMASSSLTKPDDYKEVKYEDLLENPENTMRNICDFLGCDFDEKMTSLEKPSENLGDTRGETKIIRANKGKFLKRFSKKEVKRIEEIVFEQANRLGYHLEFAKNSKQLGSVQLKILKLYDGFAILKFLIGHHGFFEGFKYFFNTQKLSSWQQKS